MKEAAGMPGVARGLAVGRRVRVRGLVRQASLNGAEGVVTDWNQQKRWWDVRLDNGMTMGLKEDKLEELGSNGNLAVSARTCDEVASETDPAVRRSAVPLVSSRVLASADEAKDREKMIVPGSTGQQNDATTDGSPVAAVRQDMEIARTSLPERTHLPTSTVVAAVAVGSAGLVGAVALAEMPRESDAQKSRVSPTSPEVAQQTTAPVHGQENESRTQNLTSSMDPPAVTQQNAAPMRDPADEPRAAQPTVSVASRSAPVESSVPQEPRLSAPRTEHPAGAPARQEPNGPALSAKLGASDSQHADKPVASNNQHAVGVAAGAEAGAATVAIGLHALKQEQKSLASGQPMLSSAPPVQDSPARAVVAKTAVSRAPADAHPASKRPSAEPSVQKILAPDAKLTSQLPSAEPRVQKQPPPVAQPAAQCSSAEPRAQKDAERDAKPAAQLPSTGPHVQKQPAPVAQPASQRPSTEPRLQQQPARDAQSAPQRPAAAQPMAQSSTGSSNRSQNKLQAGQSRSPLQATKDTAAQPLLDVEGQRHPSPPVLTHDGPDTRCKGTVIAFLKVCVHLSHIIMTVWMALGFPGWFDVEQCSHFWPCVKENLPQLKFWATILMAPFVVYETGKHWYQATYFPMTASDSFYILRFGREQDRSPLVVRRGALATMMFLSFFLSVLSFVNYITVYVEVCPLRLTSAWCTGDNWDNNSDFRKKELWVQLVLYAVSVLLQAKSFALVCTFAVLSILGFLGLGILTLGIGWVVLCAAFRNGGLCQDTKVGCVSLTFVYEFIAFFYRRV